MDPITNIYGWTGDPTIDTWENTLYHKLDGTVYSYSYHQSSGKLEFVFNSRLWVEGELNRWIQ